ncbi:MAG: hypothetical protein KC560_01135, partial [Myxococcales bacterium]|nr:hypothetical protein [Myxococcales bacterium]
MRGRPEPASDAAPGRVCGTCSLCCTVLRVDPLRKLGGVDCVHQRGGEAGCAIHGRAERPALCGAYRCAWLKGQLDLADRPDRLGATVDLVAPGGAPVLAIVEARRGAFDASPRLQAIAARFRASMPVRITAAADALDRGLPSRILRPDGSELRVRGDRVEE